MAEGKSFNDINNVESILNAITVEEAIQSFQYIDSWIIKILQCSTEDFLGLNQQFKKYHKESKIIAENATNIIQSIVDESVNDSFLHLKNIASQFSKTSDYFTGKIESIDIEVKKNTNKIDNLKLLHQNLRQNLLTINLILASEEIKYQSSGKLKNEIHEVLNFSKQLIDNVDNNVEIFIEKSNEILLLLGQIKKDNYQYLDHFNDNLQVSVELFEKKYKEANLLYASLKNMTDNNASYITSIITHLQYHDIIRQKIEHIQKTHKDILQELHDILNQGNENVILHNKAKTYIKIRDISGLQAAQLIHANNQYQIAIQEIFRSLEEIANHMIYINSLCENLVGKSEHSKKHYFESILDNLKNLFEYNHKIYAFLKLINTHAENLHEVLQNIKTFYHQIIQKNEKLFELLKIQINHKYTTSQTQQIIKDIQIQQQLIMKIWDELSEKLHELKNIIFELNQKDTLICSLQDINNTLPDLMRRIKNDIKNVDDYLNSNSTISNDISKEIKSTLTQIKYFEIFESTCENIINELNTLNIRLNYGYELSEKERQENLKILKSRYTMASEHLIHDHLSQINNIGEILNTNSGKIIEIANQKSDDDDENLELF